MSHTEYIIEAGSQHMTTGDIIWASLAVITIGASIYKYVLPRFKKQMKTF